MGYRYHYFIEKRRYKVAEPWCVYLWDREELFKGPNFRRLWMTKETWTEARDAVVSEMSKMGSKCNKT